MLKKIVTGIAALVIALTPTLASAHVVVTPKQATPASFTTFSMSVPNEKEIDVTALKLTIPSGLKHVTPTVKPGWTVNTEKTGSGEDAMVTSISWTSGTIAAGLRDDFTFSAQTPANSGDIQWKAYQTYGDGTTTSWDQAPTANESDDDSASTGPYSVTTVAEATSTNTTSTKTASDISMMTVIATALAGVALIISVIALVRNKK